MLVLKRSVGERLMLSNGITLTICAISRNSVKVGIDAPKDVLILREELQKRRPQCEATSRLNAHQTDAEK